MSFSLVRIVDIAPTRVDVFSRNIAGRGANIIPESHHLLREVGMWSRDISQYPQSAHYAVPFGTEGSRTTFG